MAIDLNLIKELREKSGAGLQNCKTALAESNGNVEDALRILKKQGSLIAQKKAGRATSEGGIAVYSKNEDHNRAAAIIELNSETDFVAKNDKFLALAQSLATAAYDYSGEFDPTNPRNIDNFKSSNIKNSRSTISDFITDNLAIIGENIQLNRAAKLKIPEKSHGIVSTYVHSKIGDNIGKIAVLIQLESNKAIPEHLLPEIQLLGKNLAMQVAAVPPQSISIDDLDKDFVNKEYQIFLDEAKGSKKPQKIIDNIAQGKLRKLYEEVVLLEQYYILDNKIQIKDLLLSFSQQNNIDISITNFIKFTLGEE